MKKKKKIRGRAGIAEPSEIETARKANGGHEIHIFPRPKEITAEDIIFVFARWRETVAP